MYCDQIRDLEKASWIKTRATVTAAVDRQRLTGTRRIKGGRQVNLGQAVEATWQ